MYQLQKKNILISSYLFKQSLKKKNKMFFPIDSLSSFSFLQTAKFVKTAFHSTSGKINGPLKLYDHKGAYWISSNSSFIQYCDSNIGLFSIAPPLVIALPTLR